MGHNSITLVHRQFQLPVDHWSLPMHNCIGSTIALEEQTKNPRVRKGREDRRTGAKEREDSRKGERTPQKREKENSENSVWQTFRHARDHRLGGRVKKEDPATAVAREREQCNESAQCLTNVNAITSHTHSSNKRITPFKHTVLETSSLHAGIGRNPAHPNRGDGRR